MYEFTDYLEHHGVLGMKWGVRRYQNKDGTRIKNTVNKAFKPGPKGKASPAEKMLNSTKDITSSSKRLIYDTEKFKNTQNADLSSYSDTELRNMVNRMNLEKQYNTLTDPGLSPGKQRAVNILETVGDVLGVMGGLAGILVAAKALRR